MPIPWARVRSGATRSASQRRVAWRVLGITSVRDKLLGAVDVVEKRRLVAENVVRETLAYLDDRRVVASLPGVVESDPDCFRPESFQCAPLLAIVLKLAQQLGTAQFFEVRGLAGVRHVPAP